MKNILILGSSGFLGSKLTSGEYLKKYKIITHSQKSETDINLNLQEDTKVIKMIKQTKPHLIINLVGLTNVDHCEKYPNEAYRLNVKTIENIVKAIKETFVKPYLIHISTDQVYDNLGNSPEKNINLLNYYAYSKYLGELFARQTSSTILRTNFFGKSKNLSRGLTDWLYNQLISFNKINVFEDVWFNPISMSYLCEMIELSVEKKIVGTFNLGSNKGMSKADFAFKFANALNFPTTNMKRTKIANYKFLNARRPNNMIMDLTKFEKNFYIKLPLMKEEIKLTAKEYLK